jgi:hypothetical protein
MTFSHLLQTLTAARGRDTWVAVVSSKADAPQAAVLHGSLGEVDAPGEQGDTAFVPVEIPREPDLNDSVGFALDPAEFEGAEGSLPGDLLVRLRGFNVRVATR